MNWRDMYNTFSEWQYESSYPISPNFSTEDDSLIFKCAGFVLEYSIIDAYTATLYIIGLDYDIDVDEVDDDIGRMFHDIQDELDQLFHLNRYAE